MTETQNQKSEIMNIDMHDTPLHKWERELNTLLAGAQHNVPACVTAALARFNDMEKNP